MFFRIRPLPQAELRAREPVLPDLAARSAPKLWRPAWDNVIGLLRVTDASELKGLVEFATRPTFVFWPESLAFLFTRPEGEMCYDVFREFLTKADLQVILSEVIPGWVWINLPKGQRQTVRTNVLVGPMGEFVSLFWLHMICVVNYPIMQESYDPIVGRLLFPLYEEANRHFGEELCSLRGESK